MGKLPGRQAVEEISKGLREYFGEDEGRCDTEQSDDTTKDIFANSEEEGRPLRKQKVERKLNFEKYDGQEAATKDRKKTAKKGTKEPVEGGSRDNTAKPAVANKKSDSPLAGTSRLL